MSSHLNSWVQIKTFQAKQVEEGVATDGLSLMEQVGLHQTFRQKNLPQVLKTA